jgi:flotillin
MLPQIAHELAAPMGNIDQLTVVSTDGASQLTKNVAGGFTEIDAVLRSTTGIDLRGLLGNFVGGAAAGAAAATVAGAPSRPARVPELVPALVEEPELDPELEPEPAV